MVQRLRRWLRPRRLLIVLGIAVFGVGVVFSGSLLWVRHASGPYLYWPDEAPARPVAIVFGSQVYSDGTPSPVLRSRLAEAQRLYAQGKIRAILVTGDNGQVQYNEVDPMRTWLIERGVPEVKVVGDYAGFDTYSSCVRAVRIFGVTEAILVTQDYHLSRAVALCRSVGMDAIGVRASSGVLSEETLRRLAWRDRLACVKAVGEIIVKPDPKYLGRHETGIEEALTSG
ncbi:MAG: YdcF family protein [Micromonosporaceae bacterium]|nr:YdcF family protein [Micromonosporaceae bacterium]